MEGFERISRVTDALIDNRLVKEGEQFCSEGVVIATVEFENGKVERVELCKVQSFSDSTQKVWINKPILDFLSLKELNSISNKVEECQKFGDMISFATAKSIQVLLSEIKSRTMFVWGISSSISELQNLCLLQKKKIYDLEKKLEDLASIVVSFAKKSENSATSENEKSLMSSKGMVETSSQSDVSYDDDDDVYNDYLL